jgi:hypothetical protein
MTTNRIRPIDEVILSGSCLLTSESLKLTQLASHAGLDRVVGYYIVGQHSICIEYIVHWISSWMSGENEMINIVMNILLSHLFST